MHLLLASVRGNSIPFEMTCAIALRLAARSSGVPASEIVASRRVSRRVSTARQIGMYLAHTAAGLPLAKVAEYFGRDRTTAAHACRLIEDGPELERIRAFYRDDRKVSNPIRRAVMVAVTAAEEVTSPSYDEPDADEAAIRARYVAWYMPETTDGVEEP